MNVNMLRDADDDPGFYVAACGKNAGWAGAVLYQSLDNGITFQSVATLTKAATIGKATTVLGDFHGGNIPDELNTVTIALTFGSLSSVSYALFQEGLNAAVLGAEILLFRNAKLNDDGTYTLSGFLRGRRGSEYAMGSHAVGDRFVLLNPATLTRIAATTADIGKTKKFKAITAGMSSTSGVAQEFTNMGAGLKPYAPAQLGGGWEANGDVTLNWVRRTRISGEWRDNVDVLLGEASENYEVEIYDSSFSTLKRTITGLTSPTATYTAAQQTTDFGAPQTHIYFKVYQLSVTVGRGYAARGSISS